MLVVPRYSQGLIISLPRDQPASVTSALLGGGERGHNPKRRLFYLLSEQCARLDHLTGIGDTRGEASLQSTPSQANQPPDN